MLRRRKRPISQPGRAHDPGRETAGLSVHAGQRRSRVRGHTLLRGLLRFLSLLVDECTRRGRADRGLPRWACSTASTPGEGRRRRRGGEPRQPHESRADGTWSTRVERAGGQHVPSRRAGRGSDATLRARLEEELTTSAAASGSPRGRGSMPPPRPKRSPRRRSPRARSPCRRMGGASIGGSQGPGSLRHRA